jgi:hypothetical protein
LPEPFTVADSAGRFWIVLHTAEQTGRNILIRPRPNGQRFDERQAWRELIARATFARRSKTPGLEVWRAKLERERVLLVVERVSDLRFRVCEVKPAEPPRRATDASVPAGLPRPPSMASSRLMRAVDPGVLERVVAELARGTVRASSAIAQALGLPIDAVRAALAVLEPLDPEPQSGLRGSQRGVDVARARPWGTRALHSAG